MFEERRRVPLGANMAARRALFDRIGLFNSRLGRCGEQLLGQEVPELLSRSRAAGARGLYVPAMVVDHHVPAKSAHEVLFPALVVRQRHFARAARSAAADDRARRRPHAGATFRWAAALHVAVGCDDVCGWLSTPFNEEKRFRHETMLCYFAGYFSARRRDIQAFRPATANYFHFGPLRHLSNSAGSAVTNAFSLTALNSERTRPD